MVLGLVVSFYMSHRRIWVLKKAGSNEVILGGDTNKNQYGFEKEFNELINQLKTKEI